MMQPIYCTWEANGSHTHTPGLFRRGRVTDARGWVNSALGELATINVGASNHMASKQEWARMWVNVPADCTVEWDAERRCLTIMRGEISRHEPETTTTPHDSYGADEADGAACRAIQTALQAVAPRTGTPCACRRGIERDNCPQCEGSGWTIDFRALRAARQGA